MSPRLLAPLLMSVILLPAALAARVPTDPADPDLTPRGRAILSWFQRLQAAPELRLVSGQFAGWSGSADFGELSRIHTAAGRWPAMIGLDYCGWMPGNHPDMALVDVRQPNQLARMYWQAGGLVNLSWHAPNPTGASLKTPGVKLADILRPGPLHDRWLESLDAVAVGLQELQAAGVVVIWRPLHEMNGGWFWWGAQEPADFISFWRHMFDYLTQTKGLHNLIWAWGPNHGQKDADLYYPGDAFVDLAGLDAYTSQINPGKIVGFKRLAGIRKPVGLTEYGPHGEANPPGDFDFRRLLAGIERHFPQLRHFLVWNEKWNPAANYFAREFYNDPRVVTREQIPAGLAGP